MYEKTTSTGTPHGFILKPSSTHDNKRMVRTESHRGLHRAKTGTVDHNKSEERKHEQYRCKEQCDDGRCVSNYVERVFRDRERGLDATHQNTGSGKRELLDASGVTATGPGSLAGVHEVSSGTASSDSNIKQTKRPVQHQDKSERATSAIGYWTKRIAKAFSNRNVTDGQGLPVDTGDFVSNGFGEAVVQSDSHINTKQLRDNDNNTRDNNGKQPESDKSSNARNKFLIHCLSCGSSCVFNGKYHDSVHACSNTRCEFNGSLISISKLN